MTLKLTVLGSNTPFPEPGLPCSGYLVDASGTLILLELGLAVWPELLQYTDPADLAAIWVSHLHADHAGDLLAAYQWAANTKDAPRLRIYGPPGWADRIGGALPAADGPDQLRRLFDVREHDESEEHIQNVLMTSVPVRHGVPAHGVRLTHEDSSIAYSGDTGPCSALDELATDADIFLCEAGAAESGNEYHCTPEDAELAGAAARDLFLTHISPSLTAAEASSRAGGAAVVERGTVLTCAHSR